MLIKECVWKQNVYNYTIVVIPTLANVGFSKLIREYKQTITVTASWCTTIHNKSYHDIYLPLFKAIPQNFNCKSLYPTFSRENLKHSQFMKFGRKVFLSSKNKMQQIKCINLSQMQQQIRPEFFLFICLTCLVLLTQFLQKWSRND